jgi:hypothetical protein
MSELERRLQAFAAAEQMLGKGGLCVALVVTRHAREKHLPLDARELLTDSGGQVLGLGKDAVQAILRDHGIERELAREGGRTSRGSLQRMQAYVALLNELHEHRLVDFTRIEDWWVERVREFFAGKPFTLRIDRAHSLRAAWLDLFAQAEKRQRDSGGVKYVGVVLQHLVGARLELEVPGVLEHFGSCAKDEGLGRSSDFVVGELAIHVTTAPGEALARKCASNLDAGLQALVVTSNAERAAVARFHLGELRIEQRVDVFEAEQFLTEALLLRSRGSREQALAAAHELIELYNQLVGEHETDPGLRIELAR